MAGHFSRYVGGLPGIGFLLLRATVGVLAILQGYAFQPGHASGQLWPWIFAAILFLAGTAILLGIFTVLSSVTLGLIEAGVVFSLLPSPALTSPHAQASPFFTIVLAFAVILIGPGAFSIDARLFGLREVKIPPADPPSMF